MCTVLMLALGAHAVPVPADVDKDGTPRALGEERHVLARLVHEVATLKATACVSSSSTPPKLHGVFENTGGVNLVSGTNQAVYPKPPAPPCIGSAFKFSQTVPSDPRLVVLTRLNPCEPGETHKGAACVDGFYETKPMAGAWVWGGCQWTLWGTDNDDIGIQIVTPMEVDAEGVASITYHCKPPRNEPGSLHARPAHTLPARPLTTLTRLRFSPVHRPRDRPSVHDPIQGGWSLHREPVPGGSGGYRDLLPR